MSKDIRIRKGLNINLVGAAEQTISKAVTSNVYALNLDDFHGITPKMLIKQGEEIKAGEPLFYNKNNEEMHFVSPVSGELVEIVRGARRKILTLKILADKEQDYIINKVPDLDAADGEAIKSFAVWRLAFHQAKTLRCDRRPKCNPESNFCLGLCHRPIGG